MYYHFIQTSKFIVYGDSNLFLGKVNYFDNKRNKIKQREKKKFKETCNQEYNKINIYKKRI